MKKYKESTKKLLVKCRDCIYHYPINYDYPRNLRVTEDNYGSMKRIVELLKKDFYCAKTGKQKTLYNKQLCDYYCNEMNGITGETREEERKSLIRRIEYSIEKYEERRAKIRLWEETHGKG